MKILSILSTLVLLFCIILLGRYLFYLIKGLFTRRKTDLYDCMEPIVTLYIHHPIISTFVAVLTIMGILVNSPFFKQSIGFYDLETCPDGLYSYYVKIESDDPLKSFTIPAKIEVVTNEYSDEHDRIQHDRRYYVLNVYWSNDDYLTFEDEEVYVNDPTSVLDIYGKEYNCTLINEHAKTDAFEEEKASTANIVSFFLEIAVLCVSWGYCIYISISRR